MDVWAVGCIFAELLLRKELFPGNNHFEQLSLIFSILGTPMRHELGWITSDDAKEWVNQLEYQDGHDLRKIFKNGQPEAIDLIKQMLEINPSKRIKVIEALSHPYFAKLHHPKSEKVVDKQMFNEYTKNNFDTFDDGNNTLFGIRHLMFDTLTHFDPYWKKKKRGKQRLVKTDRVSNHKSNYRAPPGQPPESC